MRTNSILICLMSIFCLIFSASAYAGTSLNILNQTGTEKNVNASTLRTITFSGSSLNLNYQNGNTEAVTLSTIRKIYFSSLSTAVLPAQKVSLILYPNPVSETLCLKNIAEGVSLVSIWHISGRKVLSTTVSSESATIDVSGLASGLYLLKIQNQTLRFSKK